MMQRGGANSYLLMAGQRRLAALKRLGSKTIPVLILSKNSSCRIEDAKAVSIIENLHRVDMSVSKMAASCRFLAERLGVSATPRALSLSQHVPGIPRIRCGAGQDKGDGSKGDIQEGRNPDMWGNYRPVRGAGCSSADFRL